MVGCPNAISEQMLRPGHIHHNGHFNGLIFLIQNIISHDLICSTHVLDGFCEIHTSVVTGWSY